MPRGPARWAHAPSTAILLLLAILLAAAPTPGAAPVAAGPRTSGTAGPSAIPAARAAAAPTLRQLIGQKLVVRMDGSTPSVGLLDRIGRGEVGGVILFADDITTVAALRALTARLQAAAAAGGQPRLLVMVDQEGAKVRRVPWAPPSMSARAMGADGRTATARTQGRLTGAALASLGINVDLAPVADVPSSTSSFMYLARRTFSFDASTVSRLAKAFAAGLRAGGVQAAVKHFPGIGRARQNTDGAVVTIRASRAALARDILPFRAAIAARVPIIMLSNATYAALDPANGAGWSRAVATTLLRHDLGFSGVTITDSLSGTAAARGVAVSSLAAMAAAVGTDLILLTGSEASTQAVFDRMLAKAEIHAIGTTTLRASYARIMALKARL